MNHRRGMRMAEKAFEPTQFSEKYFEPEPARTEEENSLLMATSGL